jgi:guanyl-specific ribonuclease Sa
MTLLVGTDGSGWTPASVQPAGGGGRALWKALGYTPVANGTATLAYVYIEGFGTASNVKVLAYRASDGALLAQSANIPAGAAGLKSASISLSVSTSTALKLAVLPDAGYLNVRCPTTGTTYVVNEDGMVFATPDDPLPAGSNTSSREFLIYLDGTVGDTAAPTFTAGPSVSAVGTTTATIGFTSNESGTGAVIVTSTAASQPSDAAFDAVASAITAATPATSNQTGLTPGSLLKAWVQIKDGG